MFEFVCSCDVIVALVIRVTYFDTLVTDGIQKLKQTKVDEKTVKLQLVRCATTTNQVLLNTITTTNAQ